MYEFLLESPVSDKKRVALWDKALKDQFVVFDILETIWQLDISSEQFPLISEKLWELTDKHQDLIVTFFEDVFDYEEELNFEYDKNDEKSVVNYALYVIKFINNREMIWKAIPKTHHKKLKVSYDSILDRLIQHENQFIRTRAYEAKFQIYFKTNYDRNLLEGPELSDMPKTYVDNCIDSLQLIHEKLDSEMWSLVLDRIEFLGERANSCGDELEQLLSRIVNRKVKINMPSGVAEVIEDFGRILFRIKHLSIPNVIQEAYLNRPSEMWFRYYDEWSEFAEVSRITKPEAQLSPLHGYTNEQLTSAIQEQPYEVLLECLNKTESNNSEIAKIAQQAAEKIQGILLSAEDENDIKDVVDEFSDYFIEEENFAGNLQQRVNHALEILEEKLKPFDDIELVA